MGAKEATESPQPETPCITPGLGLVYAFWKKWMTFSEALSA